MATPEASFHIHSTTHFRLRQAIAFIPKLMKMKIVFYLLSLIIATSLPAGAVKKIEANPINIAVVLTQETDSSKMASTLEYYGYVLQSPPSNGQQAYMHPNGSVIRYQYLNQKYPTVEVTSKVSSTERNKILKNLNFRKKGNTYERKSIGYTTECASGSPGSLIFTRHYKKKE